MKELFDYIYKLAHDAIAQNQVISGGLVLGLMTSVALSLKSVPGIIWKFIKRKATYTVMIDQSSELYRDVGEWVHIHFKDNLRSINVFTKYDDTVYIPADDSFYIFRSRRFIRMSFSSEKMESTGGSTNLSLRFYTFRISSIFGKSAIQSLLKEITTFSEEKRRGKKEVEVYSVFNGYGEWQREYGIKLKPLNTIFIDEDVKKSLINDITDFMNSRDFYEKRGISYRRGYMFDGPPGSGKSSLIMGIANEFKRDLYRMNLGVFESEAYFERSLSNVSKGSIIAIEDGDSFFNKRESKCKISFSGFINAISGLCNREDIIFVITTNHPEVFDEALMRTGRIDKRFTIGRPSQKTIENYIEFFFGIKVKLDGFKDKISMSDVEDICITNKNDPYRAIYLITGIYKSRFNEKDWAMLEETSFEVN